MKTNPVLRRLGYAPGDRLAIIHVDDVGMNLGSVQAFAGLWEAGLVTSGAVMVPCPWFLKAAEYARANPQADLGVHSTLTSEWKHYRWGPISTREAASGMLDEQGFFYHDARLAGERADPACAEREIEAQVQRAIAMGMRPTHVDTHMGAVANFRLMPGYLRVALRYRLPAMIFRMDENAWLARGLDPQSAQMAVFLTRQLEEAGLPLLDHLCTLELDAPENRLEQAKAAFSSLKPGITHFYIHPSTDTAELREITPDWRARVADYETFQSEALRRHVRDEGIQLIGYRALQTLMPDPSNLPALPF